MAENARNSTEMKISLRYHNAATHLHNLLLKGDTKPEHFDRAYQHWRDASLEYSDMLDKIKSEERGKKENDTR